MKTLPSVVQEQKGILNEITCTSQVKKKYVKRSYVRKAVTNEEIRNRLSNATSVLWARDEDLHLGIDVRRWESVRTWHRKVGGLGVLSGTAFFSADQPKETVSVIQVMLIHSIQHFEKLAYISL